MADSSNSLVLRPATQGATEVEANANKGFAAMHIVSSSAHAVLNTSLNAIPSVNTDDDDLRAKMQRVNTAVADLQKKLSAAQKTAAIWTESLCTKVAEAIPTQIINYSATYDAASDQILALLKSGDAPKNTSDAIDLIAALQSQVQEIKKIVDDAGAEIADYAKKVQVDHDALVGGGDAISQLIAIDNSEIEAMKAEIKALDDEIAEYHKQIIAAAAGGIGGGIFMSIIGVALLASGVGSAAGGAVIAVGVAGIATGGAMTGLLEKRIKDDNNKRATDSTVKDQLSLQLGSLTLLHTTTASLIDQVVLAQLAMSDVSVMWGTFDGVLGGVLTDLGKPNAKMSLILDELWIKAAKNNWAKLSDFAMELLGTKITVDTSNVQAKKAA